MANFGSGFGAVLRTSLGKFLGRFRLLGSGFWVQVFGTGFCGQAFVDRLLVTGFWGQAFCGRFVVSSFGAGFGAVSGPSLGKFLGRIRLLGAGFWEQAFVDRLLDTGFL